MHIGVRRAHLHLFIFSGWRSLGNLSQRLNTFGIWPTMWPTLIGSTKAIRIVFLACCVVIVCGLYPVSVWASIILGSDSKAVCETSTTPSPHRWPQATGMCVCVFLLVSQVWFLEKSFCTSATGFHGCPWAVRFTEKRQQFQLLVLSYCFHCLSLKGMSLDMQLSLSLKDLEINRIAGNSISVPVVGAVLSMILSSALVEAVFKVQGVQSVKVCSLRQANERWNLFSVCQAWSSRPHLQPMWVLQICRSGTVMLTCEWSG